MMLGLYARTNVVTRVTGGLTKFTFAAQRPFSYDSQRNVDAPRVLITGSLGQLGQGLAKVLRKKYGRENIIMSDIVKPARQQLMHYSPYLYIDVLDINNLQQVVVNYHIDWIVHFSAILSALGEQNVPLALRINIEGLHNVLEVAKQHQARIFVPSTIGAFGPTSPRVKTPDITIQRPKTIYGVSKVHGELLGEYYHSRFNLDFRSLRFPGIISADTNPGGGTTDYAVKIFHDALNTGRHECYLRPNTRLPMMYIDDCLKSVVDMLESPAEKLRLRTYNVAAMSFTPEEIGDAIKKRIPHFEVVYKICPIRQAIADSWPESLDDTGAQRDWGWHSDYNLDDMVDIMLMLIREAKADNQAKQPQSQRTLGGVLEMEISPEEKQAMEDVRLNLQEFKDSPYLQWDFNLIRWIEGWDYNMEEIIPRLTAHLKLRAMLNLDDIRDISYRQNYHPVLLSHYPWGIAGVDKQGNVVAIEPMGRSDPKGLLPAGRCSEFIRSRILDTEYIAHLVRQQEKKLNRRCGLVLIVDYDGMNTDHLWKPIMNIYITALNILQDNNPDLLVKVLCINSPTLLMAAYAIVKPFLAHKTRDKIEILSSSNWKSRLSELISEDQLPKYWGGTLKGADGDYADVIPGGVVSKLLKFQAGVETPADSELTELCVGRRSVETVSVVVDSANSILQWYFRSDQEEIIFGIRYKSPLDADSEGDEVVPIWKLNAQVVPEFGAHKCQLAGIYELVFDNSFSLLRSKTLKYRVTVVV